MSGVFSLLAAVLVGTWNGNWFPSGRAEHRAHPAVEAATITAVARMFVAAIDEHDPMGTNDVILCLNEIRNLEVATNLVAQIGRKGLKVASISAYRRRDRFDQQQDVIATTLPVVSADWARWKGTKGAQPPRGYAHAVVVVDSVVTTSVFAVHLKSNYGANTPAIAAENRQKRTMAIDQLVRLEKGRREAVVLAGDMNADRWRKEFADEEIFALLEKAGFVNVMELVPKRSRGTHPSRSYGNSTLDYIFTRGLTAPQRPWIGKACGLSDHEPVFALLTVPQPVPHH